jgi:hypothetical protein
MTAMDPRRVVANLRTTGDDATATAPRIVNGLTVRPREKVNLWGCLGILFLPDIALLFVIIGIGMHRLMRHLDAKGIPAVSDDRLKPH